MLKTSIMPGHSVAASAMKTLGADNALAVGPGAIERQAFSLLEAHPHFRGRSRLIQVNCVNGRLFLHGQLPSYYLKQVAQETLRDLEGIDCIENRIMVTGARRVVAPGHMNGLGNDTSDTRSKRITLKPR